MGNQKEIMRQNLIKEIQCYYQQYITAQNEIDLHDELFKMALNEEGKSNLNIAPLFFELIFNSLSDSYSMILARFFDKCEQAKSIPYLIDKCQREAHLFPDGQKVQTRLEEFKKQLDHDELIGEAILMLQNRRDNLYAHNDKKYFTAPEKIFKQPLHMYQIWYLLRLINEILTFLLAELSIDISGQYPQYSECYDLKNLFLKI